MFHWIPECQEALENLKHLLTTAPITAFLDFNLPFHLCTNASTQVLGAILAQVQDRRERIICCALHTLSQMEKNYPATKLECLAIVWVTAKLHPYLMSNKFNIYVYHYALQWFKSRRIGSALLYHWSVALEEFDLIIHYQPGKDQDHVDGLSRLPVEDAPPARLVRILTTEEAAGQVALELYCTTHMGGMMPCGSYSGTASRIPEANEFASR